MTREKTVGGTILKIVISIVLVIVLVVVGIYLIAKYAVGIDIIAAYSNLKKLGTTVNTETIVTYPYEKDDAMVDSINDIIELKTGETGIVVNGGDSISIDYDRMENLFFDSDFDLTDKQVACIIGSVVNEISSNENGLFNGLELCQIKFSEYTEAAGKFNSVKINYVVKISLKNIKSVMTGFPLNLIKGYLPEDLYLQSTITLTKNNDKAWSYSLKAEGTTINNLDEETTDSLVSSLATILGADTADDLGVSIGQVIVDAIIGNQDNLGLGSGLLNASDFTFKRYNNTTYYSIKFDF